MAGDRPQGVQHEAEEEVAAASKIAESEAPTHTLVMFPVSLSEQSQLSSQDRGRSTGKFQGLCLLMGNLAQPQ